ncbi:MAG: hypothetical protein ACLUUG_13165 [Lachnospiraceae bacterium]
MSKEKLKQKIRVKAGGKSEGYRGWTIDQSDGTMYFFMDKKTGWRLVVADAEPGSRFYVLEKSVDGGAYMGRESTKIHLAGKSE